YLEEPRFLQIDRLAPFQPRGTDVAVILDLMIHDLDLVLELVRAPVTDVRATGVAILTPHVDIANARLEFANGPIANVTASRVPPERRPWPWRSASPLPFRLRPSRRSPHHSLHPSPTPLRGREPRAADLYLRRRAVGGRARRGGRERAQAPPARRHRRGVRRAGPRGRGGRRARPHGAVFRGRVRRGAVEASGAPPAARPRARRLPGEALRCRDPRGLSGLPSPGRGRRRARRPGAPSASTPRGRCWDCSREVARRR